ncbi:MAG: GGDEF domain-containing protein [Sphingomonadaceae bacterium]
MGLHDPAPSADMPPVHPAPLLDRLEEAIHRFSETAARASEQTGACQQQFHNQIVAAEGLVPDPATRQIVDLARAMLATLGQLERNMRRSEAETAQLRSDLDQARREADIDCLTGLPNRRAFEREYASAFEQARREGQALYVAICDIDRFKSVNDRFGHETGDGLLRAVASVLGECAADGCFVARHGGEEFVLLMRGESRDHALARLDRARIAVSERRFISRQTKQPIGMISFSAGMADVLAECDPRAALAKADAALYRAKELGRNRVLGAWDMASGAS